MRGWITVGHGTCGPQLPFDDPEKLVGGPINVVVDDHVVELALLAELTLRTFEPLFDLAPGFGGPRAQTSLELRECRRSDEDRHASGNRALDRERAVGFEIEQRRFPFRANPADLGPKCPHALSPLEVHVLEEFACVEHPLELRVADEVVLAALLLALA